MMLDTGRFILYNRHVISLHEETCNMSESNPYLSIFLNHTDEFEPIPYRTYAGAGLSTSDFDKYCFLCENLRLLFIICWKYDYTSSFKPQPHYDACLQTELSELNKFIKKNFRIDSSDHTVLKLSPFAMPQMLRTVNSHYSFNCSYKCANQFAPPTSNMFRSWIENLIREFLNKQKSEDHLLDNENNDNYSVRKLSKKSKRLNCEFYLNGDCLLSKTPCDKMECLDFEKRTGLPVRHFPTSANQVDFDDTVYLSFCNQSHEDLAIQMSRYEDQLSMKPIEKALIHKKIGDLVTAGTTQYRIQSIQKAVQTIKNQ